MVLRAAIARSNHGLVERANLVEAIALAAVAGEHLLVIGPPGTAKSEAVRRIARNVGGQYFEYLLGRFTEPSEIFGPVDLRKLREGIVETATEGMLPEAEIAFLDEIFQGSTAILNTLLGVLNERVFRRGHTQMTCALRLCVGASNALPDDEALAAFADRFLLRVFVDPIADSQLETLLENGWNLNRNATSSSASLRDIEILSDAASRCDMTRVRPHIATAMRLLRAQGVVVSDRRIVKAQKLVAAAAILDGRELPTEADLWPLVLAVPTREEQQIARETWRDLLALSHNDALPGAAEDASQGPLARASRLDKAARELLENAPPNSPETAIEYSNWKLKLEAIARETDAGFSSENLPQNLAESRARIVQILGNAPQNDENQNA